MTDDEESGGQQVFQMRKRSRMISVPRSGETGREDGRAMHQNQGRARTMDVQRGMRQRSEGSRAGTAPYRASAKSAQQIAPVSTLQGRSTNGETTWSSQGSGTAMT